MQNLNHWLAFITFLNGLILMTSGSYLKVLGDNAMTLCIDGHFKNSKVDEVVEIEIDENVDHKIAITVENLYRTNAKLMVYSDLDHLRTGSGEWRCSADYPGEEWETKNPHSLPYMEVPTEYGENYHQEVVVRTRIGDEKYEKKNKTVWLKDVPEMDDGAKWVGVKEGEVEVMYCRVNVFDSPPSSGIELEASQEDYQIREYMKLIFFLFFLSICPLVAFILYPGPEKLDEEEKFRIRLANELDQTWEMDEMEKQANELDRKKKRLEEEKRKNKMSKDAKKRKYEIWRKRKIKRKSVLDAWKKSRKEGDEKREREGDEKREREKEMRREREREKEMKREREKKKKTTKREENKRRKETRRY